MNQDTLWTVDDLSAFLRKHKTSIYSDLRRNPAAVPPPLRIPGTSKLLWHPDLVNKWLMGFQQGQTDQPTPQVERTTPKKRGRPRRVDIDLLGGQP